MTAALAPLDIYSREITRYHPTDGPDRNADPTMSRDERIVRNLALVISIARGFAGRGLDMEDLIQEGNKGLIRAAELFDPAYLGPNGTPVCFSTYASLWIKSKINEPIHVPYNLHTIVRRWRAADRDLAAQLGRPATAAEVAGRLGLTADRAAAVRAAIGAFDVAVMTPDDSDGLDFLDELAGPAADPAILAETAEWRAALIDALDGLSPIESEVIRRRYGLDGRRPELPGRIAADLGYTRQGICAAEERAIRQLRAHFGVENARRKPVKAC